MNPLFRIACFALIACQHGVTAAQPGQQQQPKQSQGADKKAEPKKPPIPIGSTTPPGSKNLAIKAMLEKCPPSNRKEDRCEGPGGMYTSGADVQSFGYLVRDDGLGSFHLTWTCPADWAPKTLVDISVSSAIRVNRGIYRVRTIAECGEREFSWEATSGNTPCCVLIDRYTEDKLHVPELVYGTLSGPKVTNEAGVRLFINRALKSFQLAEGWPRYLYQGEVFGSHLIKLDDVKDRTISVCPVIDDKPCHSPDAILHLPGGAER